MVIHRLEYFKKIKEVRELLERYFPKKDGDELRVMLCRCGHWHNNKSKGTMREDDLMLYEILLKHGYNPSTVYKWILINQLPEDVVGKLRRKELTQKEAISVVANEKRRQETNLGLLILHQCRQVMRSL